MLALFRRNFHFFVAFALLLAVVGGLMLRYTKRELIMWVNAHNTPAADWFFQYYTHVGDGTFFVIFILVVLWFSKRLAGVALASFAVSGLSSLALKQYVFPHNLRPIKFFEQNPWEYHLIKGLKIHEYNSFPSGHTTTAFAMFAFLAFATSKRPYLGPLWVLGAFLVGYSRVYLFQHFVEDAFAGAVLGVVSAVGVWWAFHRNQAPLSAIP